MIPLTAALLLSLTTADLNADHRIGATDVAMLLADWGNHGTTDLAAMLGAYGWAWATADTGDGQWWGGKDLTWSPSPWAGYGRIGNGTMFVDERIQ